MVNRVWQHHFGEGLVRTVSDFGMRGEAPASRVARMADGRIRPQRLELKHLHRLIVNSAAYQQGNDVRREEGRRSIPRTACSGVAVRSAWNRKSCAIPCSPSPARSTRRCSGPASSRRSRRSAAGPQREGSVSARREGHARDAAAHDLHVSQARRAVSAHAGVRRAGCAA